MSDKSSAGYPATPKATPFIQRYVGLFSDIEFRDEETYDEPLPETVAVTSAGLTIARATRLTEVRQETTDDR
jgi:hypothetical protein